MCATPRAELAYAFELEHRARRIIAPRGFPSALYWRQENTQPHTLRVPPSGLKKKMATLRTNQQIEPWKFIGRARAVAKTNWTGRCGTFLRAIAIVED